MKRFNVTGVCIPNKHYMVDITEKLQEIRKLVDEGYYFTINKPRQYGKTTTILALTRFLEKDYIVIKTSFEGVGDALFETEERFCSEVFSLFADSTQFRNETLAEILRSYGEDIDTFQKLSRAITKLVKQLEKPVILIIDEVDKSSGNRVFMQFLGVLRNKYLAMNSGEDITFKSVILGGVHDIKNIKLQIRNDKNQTFNFPWNVAADFRIDLSFSMEEIETMLLEYVQEAEIQMNTSEIAKEIRYFTNGYPYLVSRICKNIDEYLDKDWSIKGVEEAIKLTLREKSTLFDDVIKNIENNEDLKAVVNELLIQGNEIQYHPIAYEKGIMYGILTEYNGKLMVHNKIFESLIYDYLLAQQQTRRMTSRFTSVDRSQFIEKHSLNMEKVLIKFQEFMYEEYREEDERFYESNGRLLFLAYLKPILNGRGFSFVEAQTRENKRMDVVVTFGNEKYIIELKIWNGEKYDEKGRKQLAEYLNIQKQDKGYMIVFNFNKNKVYISEWVTVNNKNIFEVQV